MPEKCDWLQSRFDIVGVDGFSIQEGEEVSQQCLRPDGHEGPHLVQRLDRVGGQYVLWGQDICSVNECNCGYWEEGGDPEQVCLVYTYITQAEAEKLMRDPEYDPWSEE